MTASEIANIVVTVALSQLACDLLANHFIFKGERYQRSVAALERADWKLKKAEADAAVNSKKHEKRLQRAKDDFSAASSVVSSRHNLPGMLTSVFFLILLRILGAEHKGRVMAVLPFVPLRFLQKITTRGLDWSVVDVENAFENVSVEHNQGCSFLFIYMLSALSVKFFVHKAFGTQPPLGADRGIFSYMESPQGKAILKSFGVDADDIMRKDS